MSEIRGSNAEGVLLMSAGPFRLVSSATHRVMSVSPERQIVRVASAHGTTTRYGRQVSGDRLGPANGKTTA